MVCIYCGEKTNVYNSREQKKLKQVWRRRRCSDCFSVFSTIEKVDLSKSLLVESNKGEIEEFLREKLFISIFNSLGHRKTALTDALHLTDTVIVNLFKKIKGPVIGVNIIVETSFKVLKNFDKAAATHYKAYNAL